MNKYTYALSAAMLTLVVAAPANAQVVTLPRLPSVVPSTVVLPTLPTLPKLPANARMPRFRGR